MIDYEEEIKKFQPCKDVGFVEDTVLSRDLTDVADIVMEVLRESRAGRIKQ